MPCQNALRKATLAHCSCFDRGCIGKAHTRQHAHMLQSEPHLQGPHISLDSVPESATIRQSPLTTSRTVPVKLSCSLAVAVWGGVQLRHMPAAWRVLSTAQAGMDMRRAKVLIRQCCQCWM